MAKIFSGIQPTGIINLGNYLGAVKNWVMLQEDNECFFCLVDLHAITVYQDPVVLRNQIRTNAAILLACGISGSENGRLFVQSNVSAHARLAWIFNCVARTGWLNRMTQFKDKGGENSENASTGLYVYPNLMAADICAYGATHVPVGNDQLQHIELANDIIQKFNHDYDVETFKKIEPIINQGTARIMSLRDATKKMSKSDPSDQTRINLTDTADMIAAKIRKATTDALPLPISAEDFADRPAIANLYRIFAAVTGADMPDLINEFANRRTSAFKDELTDALIKLVVPIGIEADKILNSKFADEVLRRGAIHAHAESDPIVSMVEKIVGFY